MSAGGRVASQMDDPQQRHSEVRVLLLAPARCKQVPEKTGAERPDLVRSERFARVTQDGRS